MGSLASRLAVSAALIVLATMFSAVFLPSASAAPVTAASAAPVTAATAHLARPASWSTDWADSSFCASNDVPYMGTTYNGVAACGDPYVNADSNMQGPIYYNSVELDSYGFQCVELAARYFYYVTGQTPPLGNGDAYAYNIGAEYGYNVYPAGYYGVTSTFQSSLTPGQIISMWSSSDETGHVAVVTAVNVTNGNGTITVMDENASASGTDTITVSGGTMSYEGIYPDFQWTTNLPSPQPPSAQPGIVASNNDGQMGVQLENFPLGTSYFFCHAGSGYPTGGTITNHGSFDVTSADQSWASGLCSGSGNNWIGIQATDGNSYYSNQVTLGTPPTISTARLPSAAAFEHYRASLQASAGTGGYTWSLVAGALPAGLKLSSAGTIQGTPKKAGHFSFTVTVTDSAPLSASATLSLTVAPFSVESSHLSPGVAGKSYRARLAARGGAAPLHWKVTSGRLPSGLRLARSGLISGKPAKRGTYRFTVKVTDAAGHSATRKLTITVR